MKRWRSPVAAVVVALYLALASSAATCLLSPSPGSSPLHHSGKSHVAHSAYCAWACQANPTETPLSTAPPAAALVLVAVLLLSGATAQAGHFALVSRSRAPPL